MKTLLRISICFIVGLGFSQTNVAPTVDENYVHKIVYKEAYQVSQLNIVPNNNKIETISYFDGLGRPLQSIGVRQGGKNNSNEDTDVISHFEYDHFGRQHKQYLPFSSNINDGKIINNPVSNINAFYLSHYPEDLNPLNPNPFTQQIYEKSPLNRILEQGAPGQAWIISDSNFNTTHGIKYSYTNNAPGEVIKYRVIFPNVYTDQPQLLYDGHYDSGTLYKSVIKDENWSDSQTNINDHTTEEFKDKNGRVVLKRTYNKDISHDTYYVYDDFGNLTYVLSPEGSDALLSQQNYSDYIDYYKPYVLVPTDKQGNPVTGSNGIITASVNQASQTFTLSINVSFSTPINLRTGSIVALPGNMPNTILGSIPSASGNYILSIQDNTLHIQGSGQLSTVNQDFVVSLPSYAINTNVLNDLCYQYHYDYRNRLIEKKIPGKGWEYILYDKLDRPRFTQDANLREQNKWLFTKYDALGRVVYTGTNTGSRSYLQSGLNNESSSNETKLLSPITVSGTTLHYTNNSFPSTVDELLTINYYDNYEFDKLWLNAPASNIVFGQTITSKTNGLETGSKIKVLGVSPDRWITSVTYYDDDAKAIYTRTYYDHENYHNQQLTKYNFFGQITKSRDQLRFKSNTSIGGENDFTYDHSGRVLRQRHRVMIGGSSFKPWETIAVNSYDDLGQLISKKVGNTESSPLQTVDYNYNIRGWLKQINDLNNLGADLFAFKLNYDTTETVSTSTDQPEALFNGNISETLWKTAYDEAANIDRRGYYYLYDNLNRITKAMYQRKGSSMQNGRFNLNKVEYDKNGNILKLNRTGKDDNGNYLGTIDELVYTYNGNQLTDVKENANHNYGFIDAGNEQTGDYEYDANGNLILDRNKNITNISYNHLNLPTKVTLDTGIITYIYDATGVKLVKMVSEVGQPTITTQYAGNFQYNDAGSGTDVLKFFNHIEGYIEPNGTEYDYAYQYKDHLGNIRLTYADSDGDGSINATTEIIEENNYYPFGLEHKGYNNVVTSTNPAQDYKFNGVELEESLGLNLYEMTWRNYDASLGRFMQIDPFAEYYGQYDKSPFAFAWNNPIVFKDPSGLCPDCPDPSNATQGDIYTIGNGNQYIFNGTEWERHTVEELDEVVVVAPSGGNSNSNNSSTNIQELQQLGAGSLGANIGGSTVAPMLEKNIPNLIKDDFLIGRIDPKYATDFSNSTPSTAMGNVYEKGADDALRALNKVRVATKVVGTVGNVAGYSTAVSEAAHGNYGGAAVEGTSASISWKLGSIYWLYGVAWSAGWEAGRAITNTEAYNRRAFGIYSDIYIKRKIANNWGPLTPVQQHLAEARNLY